MEEALGAAKGERSGERRGHRSGYYGRKLTTRVGTLKLRVPQDRGACSGRRCSRVTSAERRRYCSPWPRCTCKASRRARYMR